MVMTEAVPREALCMVIRRRGRFADVIRGADTATVYRPTVTSTSFTGRIHSLLARSGPLVLHLSVDRTGVVVKNDVV